MYDGVLIGIFAVSPLVLVSLLFMPAPYGRHAEGKRWGPVLPPRWAWVLMECPAVLAFAAFYARGEQATELVPLVLLAMWMAHYVHRAFIYPFRIAGGRPVPLAVAAMGFLFNVANAYLNGTWISEAGYASSWLADPRFIVGAALFAGGYALNRWSDAKLRALRAEGPGYRVPRGGMFELVSCPNYTGEMIEWAGWALATWSLSGLAFAVFTVANLLPRAISHHRFYREKLPDYPPRRKAAIPFVL